MEAEGVWAGTAIALTLKVEGRGNSLGSEQRAESRGKRNTEGGLVEGEATRQVEVTPNSNCFLGNIGWKWNPPPAPHLGRSRANMTPTAGRHRPRPSAQISTIQRLTAPATVSRAPGGSSFGASLLHCLCLEH